MIAGTSVFSSAATPWAPFGAPGSHSTSPPEWQALGKISDSAGVAFLNWRSWLSSSNPTSCFSHSVAFGDRAEVDDRVAPGRVLVARGRDRRVGAAEGRLAAAQRLADRAAVFHVLDVGAPGHFLFRQLGRQRFDFFPVDAAVAFDLFGGFGDRAGRDRRVVGAVGRGFGGRALAAQQRDLVGEHAAGDAVVVGDQLALLRQHPREVGRFRGRRRRCFRSRFRRAR